MTSILKVDNIQKANGSVPKASDLGINTTGSVLQVVSTTKTDTYSATVAAGAASDLIPGLTATITPSSTNSKVLVTLVLNAVFNTTAGQNMHSILFRDTTALGIGDAAGSRSRVTSSTQNASSATSTNLFTISFLDSPATTSAITYGVKVRLEFSASRVIYINRTETDTDNVYFARKASTITVQEIGG